MLQQDEPDDYVVATGRDPLRCATSAKSRSAHVGLDWEKHVVVDPRYFRPAEVDLLLGDAGQGAEKLGWAPEIDARGARREMVDADLERLRRANWP